MGHDDAGQVEWINAWAEAQRPKAANLVAPLSPDDATAAKPVAAALQRVKSAATPDQLVRDIVEITQARDALTSIPVRPVFVKQRTQAITLAPPRTTDGVPVMIGGIMALVLLAVFGAAATMTKLAR